MKRTLLLDQWNRLDKSDLATLNVGRGTIEVFDPDKKKDVPYRLPKMTLDLIKHAYERGLKREPLY